VVAKPIEELLRKLKPALVIYLGEKNNRYRRSNYMRLEKEGAEILRTNLAVDIEVVSDGAKWYTR